MISYIFDHEYAGDLASLGIEYLSLSNDHEIEVIESVDHELTGYFKEHSSHYYVIN